MVMIALSMPINRNDMVDEKLRSDFLYLGAALSIQRAMCAMQLAKILEIVV